MVHSITNIPQRVARVVGGCLALTRALCLAVARALLLCCG